MITKNVANVFNLYTYSTNLGKSVTIDGKELLKESKVEFVSFVKENYRKSFVSSLLNLRYEIALLRIGSPLLIMGVTNNGSNDYVKFVKEDTQSDEKTKRQKLEINCDFYKEFGYPCEENEIPARNPNVFIKKEKKL